MFDKFKKIMRLNKSKQLTDEEWNESLERQGGLEKHDFLAMVIAALIVILPISLLLLLTISLIWLFL